jgi:hypothetical protein
MWMLTEDGYRYCSQEVNRIASHSWAERLHSLYFFFVLTGDDCITMESHCTHFFTWCHSFKAWKFIMYFCAYNIHRYIYVYMCTHRILAYELNVKQILSSSCADLLLQLAWSKLTCLKMLVVAICRAFSSRKVLLVKIALHCEVFMWVFLSLPRSICRMSLIILHKTNAKEAEY